MRPVLARAGPRVLPEARTSFLAFAEQLGCKMPEAGAEYRLYPN